MKNYIMLLGAVSWCENYKGSIDIFCHNHLRIMKMRAAATATGPLGLATGPIIPVFFWTPQLTIHHFSAGALHPLGLYVDCFVVLTPLFVSGDCHYPQLVVRCFAFTALSPL